ncbi:MAG: DUF3244 domain-containing protein [Saprospiraceae bacterium]|nr:DUF3244 domain-containing protein [Saprospiraceae bacterium]
MMKYLLILTMAAVNTGLMAADIPVHINAANKWIIVEKAKWNSPSIDVLIRENSGAVLIHESIGQTTKYNLKNVPDGEYILEVENDQKIRIQTMSLHDGILQSKAISTIYKPNIKVNNQVLDMNLMTQGKSAEIMIKNEEGKVMITEKIENEVSVTRRFNIKKLDHGNYYLEVHMAGQTFINDFEK